MAPESGLLATASGVPGVGIVQSTLSKLPELMPSRRVFMKSPILATTLWLVLLVQGAAPSGAAAQSDISPEFRAAVVELMELTGSADIGTQFAQAMMTQINGAIRRARPDIPPRAFEIVEEVVNSELRDALSSDFLHALTPIYAKYFTEEDIRSLIDFYKTPLGRKTITTMPAVLADAMAVGQATMRERAPRIQSEIQRRLSEEGLLPQ
jgi:hypothetical protein